MEDDITRTIYFLVTLFIVLIWYGIVPIAGALYNRYKWRQFRKRYNDLRLSPLLDYRAYRNLENDGALFRFTGGIESLTDGKTLWVRGRDCTISVSLEKTQCWLLPMHEDDSIPGPPAQIKWNRVSTLTEGVRVFIGGRLKLQDNRLNFVSSQENPAIIIFYNCPEEELTGELILAARTRNEYWNSVTPISIAIGALSLVYIAASLLNRLAFRLNVIIAMIGIFVPALPIIPPGLLFTAVYRRLTGYARKLRAYRDLAEIGINAEYSVKPTSAKAYILEVAAWLIMIAGITVNVFFIYLIYSLLD